MEDEGVTIAAAIDVNEILVTRDCLAQNCAREAERGSDYCRVCLAGIRIHARTGDPLVSRHRVWYSRRSVEATNKEAMEVKASSEVRDLERKIRDAGFRLVTAGSGHKKIMDSRGALVLAKTGAPVTISITPSDRHWRANAVRELLAAGVFEVDPYRSGASGTNGDKKGFASPAVQAAKIAAIHAKSERQRGETAALRARFEPIVVKLGGWMTQHGGTGVAVTEVGEVVHYFGIRQGMKLGRKGTASVANLRGASQIFKTKDGTLGSNYLPLFTAFLDYLEQDSGVVVDHELASLRYLELLRETKGAPPAAAPEPEPEGSPLTLVDEGEDDGRAADFVAEDAAEPPFTRSSPQEVGEEPPPEEEARDVVEEVEVLVEVLEVEGAEVSAYGNSPSEWPALRAELTALIERAEEQLTAPPIKAPELALEAMALMMKAEIVDEKRVLAVASKIAELELNQ